MTAWIRAAQADGGLNAGDPAFAATMLQGQLKALAFWPQVAMGAPPLEEAQQAPLVEAAASMFLAYFGQPSSNAGRTRFRQRAHWRSRQAPIDCTPLRKLTRAQGTGLQVHAPEWGASTWRKIQCEVCAALPSPAFGWDRHWLRPPRYPR